jgi:hypothetical protein
MDTHTGSAGLPLLTRAFVPAQVTDEPHIFSGGFAFRFDARRPLGYIVPEWVARRDWPARVVAALAARGDPPIETAEAAAHVVGTVMYLPLRPDVRPLQDGLATDLLGASQTILFLRRYRRARSHTYTHTRAHTRLCPTTIVPSAAHPAPLS